MKGFHCVTVTHGLFRARAIWLALWAVMCSAPGTVALAAPGSGSDVLARSIALYPKLKSYADTGTVVVETTGKNWERYKFKTYFRQNADYSDLYFDFQGLQWKSGELIADMPNTRRVLWMTNGELQSFNQETRAHESFPRDSGRQPGVLQGAGSQTRGASILIPSLIYAKANLPGTILQIQQSSDAGFETVNGHRCHKVTGMAAAYYPSGQITSVRPVTVWIDAETLLIRKVFEDSPKGFPPGSYSHLTFTFEPQANPTLDDSKFQFKIPASQQ
jgi:hypothetical protein